MQSNFDRATIWNDYGSSRASMRMTRQEFYDYVAQDAPNAVREHPVLSRQVTDSCYSSISVLDAEKVQAYEDARASAISKIQSRLDRSRVIAFAKRSVAPSIRNAPIPSMTDLRGGAYDRTEDDGLD